MILNKKPRKFKNINVSKDIKIIIYKILQKESNLRPTTRLLLLNKTLLPFIAKVYLNLGRLYSSDDRLSVKLFDKYLIK